MTSQRIAVALTAINLALLLLTLSQARSVTAQASVVPSVRANVIELVDDHGQTRSRLNVESGGEVVFRLMDQNGTIRVKLGADESGSGLLLTDERTEPGIHLIARRVGTAERPKTTSITLAGADGKERVISPDGP